MLEPVMAFTDWLWGWPIIFVLGGSAFILTISLKGFQFRYFWYIISYSVKEIFSKEKRGEGTISPFQACASALAATLGTGNIAGVAVAISLGGPGALFWMWLVAGLALILKFAEITLALEYREHDPETGEMRGGFMYMLTKAFGPKWAWLAWMWAFLMSIEMLLGPAVQANAVSATLLSTISLPTMVTGIVCSVSVGIVLIGGIRRIAGVADKLVPSMAVLYFVGALGVILSNISVIPQAFMDIFTSAFAGGAAVGGFAGSTIAMAIRHGLARGVCANEAGMGTAPFAHIQATTDNPVRQGIWGIFEVFISSFVVCTITGLAIMCTGVLGSGTPGAHLASQAFGTTYPGLLGPGIVSISLVLFAFTTMLVNAYYGEKCFAYAVGQKYMLGYRLLVCAAIALGAVGGLRQVWGIMDTFMGITVIINVIVVLALRHVVVRKTEEFIHLIRGEKEAAAASAAAAAREMPKAD